MEDTPIYNCYTAGRNARAIKRAIPTVMTAGTDINEIYFHDAAPKEGPDRRVT